MSTQKIIYVPFDTPGYINGAHPLVDTFTSRDSDFYKFTRDQSKNLNFISEVNYAIQVLANDLLNICHKLSIEGARSWELVYSFILTRKPNLDYCTNTNANIVFHHTVPYSLNNRYFFIHIETISQIFQPIIQQGTRHNGELKHHYVFHFVKFLLESHYCLQIFTNLNFTVDQVKKVFQSPVINNKLRYIRPSPCLTPLNIGDFTKRKNHSDDLTILFTNSYHDNPDSFYLRGGLDLLAITLELCTVLKNLKLIVRSSIPQDLRNSNLWNEVKSCSNIKWIEDRISEQDLIDLYTSSDIFYLHSNSLHSLSILRGMALGLACIVSDVPGVSEYIINNINGIQLTGQYHLICHEEASTGWIYDDYSSFLSRKYHKGINYEELKSLIAQFASNKEIVREIGLNACKHIEFSFNEEESHNEFKKMIYEI